MEGLLSEFAAPSLTRKTQLPRRDILSIPSQRQAHGISVDIDNSTSRDSGEGTLALVTWLNGLNAIRRRRDRASTGEGVYIDFAAVSPIIVNPRLDISTPGDEVRRSQILFNRIYTTMMMPEAINGTPSRSTRPS